MEVRRFRVKVLTPVHIGTGKTMAPEEYFIENSRLVRFRPEAVLRSWAPAQREDFEKSLRNGDLKAAWAQLRSSAGRLRASWLYEIVAGEDSARELGAELDPSRRRGDVLVLPWNLVRREVMIPGSAIKGALRTALVNGCVKASLEEVQNEVDASKQRAGSRWRRTNDVWRAMEMQALGLRPASPDEPQPIDPLSLLKVTDAVVPSSMVRVDRAEVRNLKGGKPTRAIQIHCERLLAAADEQPAEFLVEIGLDRKRALNPRVRRLLPQSFDWNFLTRATNAYFYGRLDAEKERFKFLSGGAARWLPPGQWWEGGRLLLRLGRFCHFESLSVDDLRDGYNPQRDLPISEGNSRTVIVVKNNPVPFGWVLLEPEQ